MTEMIEHGSRRFEVMAYSDAIHDAWAVELAELVDGELGPAVLTVLFPSAGSAADSRVLVADGSLPLSVVRNFMALVAQEGNRIGEAPEM